MREKNILGKTVFHVAAYCGGFGDIPKEMFTEKALLRKRHKSKTLLHLAVCNRTLGEIPILTPKMLMYENKLNQTVWSYAEAFDTLKQIPEHIYKNIYETGVEPNVNEYLLTKIKEQVEIYEKNLPSLDLPKEKSLVKPHTLDF